MASFFCLVLTNDAKGVFLYTFHYNTLALLPSVHLIERVGKMSEGNPSKKLQDLQS